MTSFYDLAIPPLIRTLRNHVAFVEKGVKYIEDNNIDPAEFLTARIHPDMFPFTHQIYRSTDAAKAIAPRINPSIEGMTLPDTESTFPELLARLEKTITYLESIKPEDLNGREDASVQLPVTLTTPRKFKTFQAKEYVQMYAIPNFYFHVTTAYAILRAKGVDVGKTDFLNGAGFVQPDA